MLWFELEMNGQWCYEYQKLFCIIPWVNCHQFFTSHAGLCGIGQFYKRIELL